MVGKVNFALESVFKIKDNYPKILADFWGDDIFDYKKFFLNMQDTAIKCNASFVSFYLNIDDENEIDEAVLAACEIAKIAKIKTLFRGSGNKNLDLILLPKIASCLPSNSILGCIQDTNYKEIISAIKHAKNDLTIVARTPIDINLTKELNILSIDEGIKPNKILIDPDMGAVGYGIDYGFSIIQRIILAAHDGDKMLDMPIIVFAGEESFKAKEAKSADFKSSWGNLETRSLAWEIVTANSLIDAGATYIVLWHPNALKNLMGVYKNA